MSTIINRRNYKRNYEEYFLFFSHDSIFSLLIISNSFQLDANQATFSSK